MADFIGTPGDDVLVGTPDADFMAGLEGNDNLSAGAGDDFAFGDEDNDVIDLGDGFDQGVGNAGDDVIFGGAGNDHLYGEISGETESGVTGNDVLRGGDGDDFLRGGLGDDILDGGAGSDRTSYFSSPGAVHIDLRIQGVAQNTGSAGWDTLINVENTTGSIFADVLIGNHQNNWIWSHGGGDSVTGNAGDDTIWLPSGDGAVVHGNQGHDVVSFTGRNDAAITTGITVDLGVQGSAQDTGLGFVTLRSIEGAEGSEFNDTVEGNSGDNTLSGRAGDDVIDGLGGDDLIQGDVPIRIVGEFVFDFNDPSYIHGNDTLSGGGGEDAIYGDRGDDMIDGGNASDTIIGGGGADRLIGGGGDDQFVYLSGAESSSTTFDTLVGFNFNNGDILDTPGVVTSTSQVIGGTLDAATFDANLSAEMNAGVLSAWEAVMFTPTAGSYSGQTFVIVDANGLAGYQAAEDLVLLLESPVRANLFDVNDFA